MIFGAARAKVLPLIFTKEPAWAAELQTQMAGKTDEYLFKNEEFCIENEEK